MKASLKFREEKKPVFRAKVPISVGGVPFQSGVVAGEAKELSLNLSTFFESGPSIKLSYRPNDSWNPFSVAIRTGTGSFGSPISSPFIMSAEFNLLGKGNPNFVLHLKPRFGDFSLKKSQSSSDFETLSKSLPLHDASIEMVDLPNTKTLIVLPPRTAAAIAGAISGVEVGASTSFPVTERGRVAFRWGMKCPTGFGSGNSGLFSGFDSRKMPFLVMNKVCVEFKGKEGKSASGGGADLDGDVYRQVEGLKRESLMMRKTLDDVRKELVSGGCSAVFVDRSSGRRDSDRNNVVGGKFDRLPNEKKTAEMDVAEELKKSLKGAGAGI